MKESNFIANTNIQHRVMTYFWCGMQILISILHLILPIIILWLASNIFLKDGSSPFKNRPMRLILRLIVEGGRFKYLAIERMDKSATAPLEISSYSDRVRALLDGLRRSGRMPPVGANILKIEEEGRSNNRPIEVRDSPFSQRTHISCF